MPERLFKLYQRKRIVNINVNIVFAGLLAMGLTLIPVHLTRRFGIDAEIAITKKASSYLAIVHIRCISCWLKIF